MSLQTKKQVLGWGILKMLHEEHGGNDEIVTIGLTHRDISTSIHALIPQHYSLTLFISA